MKSKTPESDAAWSKENDCELWEQAAERLYCLAKRLEEERNCWIENAKVWNKELVRIEYELRMDGRNI